MTARHRNSNQCRGLQISQHDMFAGVLEHRLKAFYECCVGSSLPDMALHDKIDKLMEKAPGISMQNTLDEVRDLGRRFGRMSARIEEIHRETAGEAEEGELRTIPDQLVRLDSKVNDLLEEQARIIRKDLVAIASAVQDREKFERKIKSLERSNGEWMSDAQQHKTKHDRAQEKILELNQDREELDRVRFRWKLAFFGAAYSTTFFVGTYLPRLTSWISSF